MRYVKLNMPTLKFWAKIHRKPPLMSICTFMHSVTALKAKRGKPRDQQLWELLSTYYTMCQQCQESVADFAHRFTEMQNELEKLLPKIHRTPDADGNTEVELITAFIIKLREPIAKELISRDVKYSSLQALISAAERFELHLPYLASNKPVEDFSTWESAVNYSGTFPRGPSRPQSRDTGSFNHARAHSEPSEHKADKLNSSGIHSSGTRPRPNNFQSSSSQKNKEICLMFNKFKSSTCELPNNQCASHRLHKCSFCQNWACKACNHKSHSQGYFNKSKCNTYQGQAHVSSNASFSGKGAGDHDHSHPSRSPTEPSSNPQLTTVLSRLHSFTGRRTHTGLSSQVAGLQVQVLNLNILTFQGEILSAAYCRHYRKTSI